MRKGVIAPQRKLSPASAHRRSYKSVREESDLDLLVDPGRSTSLLTIAGLKIDAEKLLGVPVSILTPNGLPPKFRNEVLQQAQPL